MWGYCSPISGPQMVNHHHSPYVLFQLAACSSLLPTLVVSQRHAVEQIIVLK